jgi:Carboxypeptidase regulatory-like domain
MRTLPPATRAASPPRAAAATVQSVSAFALAAALVVFAAAPRALAQQPAAKDSKPAGAVTGRVTDGEGRPAAGLALALIPNDFEERRRAAARATTDSDGRYRMANVPAGRYRLQLLAPALTSPQTRGGPFDDGRLINVAAGETVEGADLRVERGGVITGRVTTGDGKPVIGERVRVTHADKRGVEAEAANPFEWETDDRGVYRIYGLPAGRYHVSLGEDRESGMVVIGATGARYARTYHPATSDPSQARVVELAAGAEATGVDVTLLEGPKSYTASGRIVDADTGRPVADVEFAYGTLRPGGSGLGAFGSDGSKTNQNGEFTIRNLLPGRYAAFAYTHGRQSDSYSEPAPFDIVDSNVTGLVIRMRRGATVAGTAVIEGTTDRAILSRLQKLTVFAHVTTPRQQEELTVPSYSDIPIGADGTFRLTGLRPGRLTVGLGGWPPPRGFTLLRVERGGVEVPREGVEIGPGDQLSGLRLVIGYGNSTVRGQVSVVNAGQPAALAEGARLIVSLRRAGAGSGSFGNSTEVDSRGTFMLEGVMPGEYQLTLRAFTRAESAGVEPPRFPVVRQTVTVLDGETTLSLVYDLSKPVERSNP